MISEHKTYLSLFWDKKNIITLFEKCNWRLLLVLTVQDREPVILKDSHSIIYRKMLISLEKKKNFRGYGDLKSDINGLVMCAFYVFLSNIAGWASFNMRYTFDMSCQNTSTLKGKIRSWQ